MIQIIDDVEMKQCSKCRDKNPIANFNKQKSSPDGLHYYCRICDNAVNAKYRQEHPEKCRASGAKWKKKYPGKCRVSSAKWRATEKGCLHQKWADMNSRCYNPNDDSYLRYGVIGIKVEWSTFEDFREFVEGIGIDIRGRDIHRLDPDGNYGPENVAFPLPWMHRQTHKNLRKMAVA